MKSCAPSGAGISTPLSPTGLARGYILTPLRGWDLDAAFTHGLAPVATFLRRSAAGISTPLSPTGLRPWLHSYAALRLGFHASSSEVVNSLAQRLFRHQLLQLLRLFSEPGRILGGAVKDGRGLERLEHPGSSE